MHQNALAHEKGEVFIPDEKQDNNFIERVDEKGNLSISSVIEGKLYKSED